MKSLAFRRSSHIIDCLPPHRGKDGRPTHRPSLAFTIVAVLLAFAIAVLWNLLAA